MGFGLPRLGCMTRVNEGMNEMVITGAKVTTEYTYDSVIYADKQFIVKLEFDIPGGVASFEIKSTESTNKAIETVMTLRGKK